MKILYVTGMAGPIIDILKGKKENEITHAAQFFHVWHKLVKNGHQVDFIVASNFNEKPNIQVDWFSEENIYANIYDPYVENMFWLRRLFRQIKRFTKLLYYTNKAIKENKYDFVYCKAYYEGLAGNIIANLRGVPCGTRSMGTMLNEDFKKHGIWGTAIRRPAEFITFKLKKDFFIMTDDGTKGDVVYEAWKPRKEKYKYCFWKTGINLNGINEISSRVEMPKHPYIFFAARFDYWKRHDKILKVLKMIHLSDKMIHVYFAGGVQSQGYFREINKLANKLGLSNYVHYLGTVTQDDLKKYAYHAVANLLLQDVTNLGNVFFETFTVGGVVVGLNDGTLDEFVIDKKNGFLVNDESEAAECIINLLHIKSDEIKHVKDSAILCAHEKFLSMDKRFDMEVKLIERFSKH